MVLRGWEQMASEQRGLQPLLDGGPTDPWNTVAVRAPRLLLAIGEGSCHRSAVRAGEFSAALGFKQHVGQSSGATCDVVPPVVHAATIFQSALRQGDAPAGREGVR